MTTRSSTLLESFWTASVKTLSIAVTRNAPKNPPSNDFLGKGHNHPAKIRFLKPFYFYISPLLLTSSFYFEKRQIEQMISLFLFIEFFYSNHRDFFNSKFVLVNSFACAGKFLSFFVFRASKKLQKRRRNLPVQAKSKRNQLKCRKSSFESIKIVEKKVHLRFLWPF